MQADRSSIATLGTGRRTSGRAGGPPGAGRLTGAALFVIALATGAAFLPVVRNGFVDWDDLQVLAGNEHIRDLSPENLRWMATTAHMAQWQPLGWFLFALQYQLFAFDARSFAAGLHAVSLGLHAAAALLCFLIVRRLLVFGRGADQGPASSAAPTLAAAFAALFFALHPLRVEVVAWATAQPYLWAFLGCLGCVWFHLRAVETGRGRERALSLACFGLSLLCKPIGVPLPFVLAVLDSHPLGRASRSVWIEKLPYAIMSAITVVITPLAKSSFDSPLSLAEHGVLARVAQAAHGFWFYPWKTLAPAGLSPIYELHTPLAASQPRYLIALAACAALLVFWIVRGRRLRLFTSTLLSYALLILPLLGFLQSGHQETADRYAYLPAAAFSPALAAGALALTRRLRPPAARAVFVALALALGFLAISSARQSGIWRTSETLWRRAAEVDPGSSIAQNSYGYVLLEQGRADEAIARFREAIRIMPENEQAHRNLWLALHRQGRIDEMIAALREAESIFPDLADIRVHLGNAHARRGEHAEAIAAYREALARAPAHVAARTARANVLEESGDHAGAIAEARAALARDPRQTAARLALARASWATGEREPARAALRDILALEPRQPDALRLLRTWEGEP